MAKPNAKKIKSDLEQWAIEKGKLNMLNAQRETAIAPIREKYMKAIDKAQAEFLPQVAETELKIAGLAQSISDELNKGFDANLNDYVTKRIDVDLASVEVNTSETREIDSAQWLAAFPKSEQTAKFFGTLKVLIGNATKLRSDLVEKLSTKKTIHSILLKLKPQN